MKIIFYSTHDDEKKEKAGKKRSEKTLRIRNEGKKKAKTKKSKIEKIKNKLNIK